MSKIEKTIARQKQKIAEGQFYEAHQQLRVITSRYLKATPPSHDSAIDLLFNGAQLLLNAGQGGSGGDLGLYLIDVYNNGAITSDAQSKGRLLTLLRCFPPGEPTKKRFVSEMMGWSAEYSDYPAGDPELHHVAGQLFAEEGEPYDAERHLALGTRDSAPLLTNLEYTWYSTDEPHTAPLYLARALFPFLLVGNLRAANTAFLLFTSKLSSLHPALAAQQISSSVSEARVYPSLPLLNFLSLLLLAVQRGSQDLFRMLQQHYKQVIMETTEGSWDDALQHVGEMYFGIKPPQQGNPLMDMMAGMFGGGGGGGGSKTQRQRVTGPENPAVD
ncbi:MAG: hypothetical protein Q9162_003263 [Coniocarpon cinnabarinum]